MYKESSQGTTYNVERKLGTWASVKVAQWDREQRDAIWKELTRLDREFHGVRVEERQKRNKL